MEHFGLIDFCQKKHDIVRSRVRWKWRETEIWIRFNFQKYPDLDFGFPTERYFKVWSLFSLQGHHHNFFSLLEKKWKSDLLRKGLFGKWSVWGIFKQVCGVVPHRTRKQLLYHPALVITINVCLLKRLVIFLCLLYVILPNHLPCLTEEKL